MPHFHYCSSIWHHLKSDSKKMDRLHERALRYLYGDESSQTSTLFDRIGYSLVDRRIQNLLIIVFKTINNYPPEYLRDLFRLRDNIKNLIGVNKYRKLIERERKRERPLFIHIRVVHSDALATAINWGPNKD